MAKNITEDGAVESKQVGGGSFELFISGAFDGASVALERSIDNTTWVPVFADTDGTAYAQTTAGAIRFDLAGGYVRANVSSAGDSTDLDVWITSISKGA
jgi:hypothetical protein